MGIKKESMKYSMKKKQTKHSKKQHHPSSDSRYSPTKKSTVAVKGGYVSGFLSTCKHYIEPTITFDGLTICAGSATMSSYKDIVDSGAEVMIDLTGDTHKPLHSHGFVKCANSEISDRLNRKMKRSIEFIYLDWDDYTAPPVGLDFWQELKTLIKEKQWKTIALGCVGGHGRTGTAICALMIAHGYSAESAIKNVREIYCKKCVENESQRRYLYELSGEEYVPPAIKITPEERSTNPYSRELEFTSDFEIDDLPDFSDIFAREIIDYLEATDEFDIVQSKSGYKVTARNNHIFFELPIGTQYLSEDDLENALKKIAIVMKMSDAQVYNEIISAPFSKEGEL